MSASNFVNTFPLALLGGIPTSVDLAPAIVFTLAYVVLLPLAFYRYKDGRSRTKLLIRPIIFCFLRIPAAIIRAVQSQGHYAIGLFIAEQILLLSGFLLIIEPSTGLLNGYLVPLNHPWLLRLRQLLRLACIAAIVLGVYAASSFGNLSDPSTLKAVKSCRDANAALCIAIPAIVAVVAVFFCFTQKLPHRPMIHLVAISALLIIVSSYKIAVYVLKPDPISHGTKTALYLLSFFPEYLATVLYFSFNLVELYDLPEHSSQRHIGVGQDEYKVEEGQRADMTSSATSNYYNQGTGASPRSPPTFPPSSNGASAPGATNERSKRRLPKGPISLLVGYGIDKWHERKAQQ